MNQPLESVIFWSRHEVMYFGVVPQMTLPSFWNFCIVNLRQRFSTRYEMKTTSPSQQIPSSLTELSLVDQINTHFWTLHQTKLCNCDIPLAQGKNVVHRAMTLQDEPDRGDVRILFYRHSLLQQLDVHIATL